MNQEKFEELLLNQLSEISAKSDKSLKLSAPIGTTGIFDRKKKISYNI